LGDLLQVESNGLVDPIGRSVAEDGLQSCDDFQPRRDHAAMCHENIFNDGDVSDEEPEALDAHYATRGGREGDVLEVILDDLDNEDGRGQDGEDGQVLYLLLCLLQLLLPRPQAAEEGLDGGWLPRRLAGKAWRATSAAGTGADKPAHFGLAGG
jgi:hypothetical protein